VVAGVAATVMLAGFVAGRRWQLHWGATDAEVAARMPGDDLVERPSLLATRAVEIDAPPEAVWPWLVQMGGYTRAGWYSYDMISNGGNPSATTVVPELQQLAVGDVLPTGPGGVGFVVERIEPPHVLVLAIRLPAATTSWTCQVTADGAGRSRLVSRLRVRTRFTPGGLFYGAVLDPGDFVMMRKALLGIKWRAESLPSPSAPLPVS
jgi:hypothetical protein